MKSLFLKDTLKLASSNVILYVLPILVMPILTRLYGPNLFAEWGIFSSVFSILSVILCLGYENAILKVEKKEVVNLVILCFFASILLTVLVFLLFEIGKFFDVDFFLNFPSSTLLYICMIVSSILYIMQNIANRNEKYWLMSLSNLALGGGQAGFRLLFAFYSIFPNGLIVGTVLAQILDVIVYKVGFKGIIVIDKIRNIKISKVVGIAKKYKQFPLYDAPAMLLQFAALNMPLIILSNFFDKTEIGCYTVVTQLLLPISFVGAAIGKVYYQRISVLNEDISKITTEILKYIYIISIVPALFICLGGDRLFQIFLGDDWSMAGNVSISLVLWSIPTILTQPLISVYRKYGVQNKLLFFNICYFIFGCISVTIFSALGYNLLTTLFIYAIICSLIKFSLFMHILKLTNILNTILVKRIFAIVFIVAIFILFRMYIILE